MTETHWKILRELRDGTLTWGAAVGMCWPELVKAGYVELNFGNITPAGIKALKERE